MNQKKKQSYDEAIRHSIEKENATRNQRTNWFLVLEGLLITGLINSFDDESPCCQEYVVVAICCTGILSAISFWYAAWRSDLAIKMLIASWDRFRRKHNIDIDDAYPVMPMTEGIVKNMDKPYISEREADLAARMNISKWDKLQNGLDSFLMPYKFFPCFFAAFWLVFSLYALVFNPKSEEKAFCFVASLLIVLIIGMVIYRVKRNLSIPLNYTSPKVIYHVLIDRFTGKQLDEEIASQETIPGFRGGTIRGVTEHLDYINFLGCDGVMLSPFFKTQSYHGYHTLTDKNEIDSRFGTNEDVESLIKAARTLNITCVADFVPNHCHEDSPLFSEHKHDDWFCFDSEQNKFKCYNDISYLPVFNFANIQVWEYLARQALQLCKWGFSALRVDHAVGPSYECLRYIRQRVKEEYPYVKMIGEVVGVENFTPHDEKCFQANKSKYSEQEAMQMEYIDILDGALDYAYYEIIKDTLVKGERILGNKKLTKKVKAHFKRYPTTFDLWLFVDNHDQNRIMAMCNDDIDIFNEVIDFTLSLNKTAIIYYGTELGMTNSPKLNPSVPYDDERVRMCFDWSKAGNKIIKKFHQKSNI